MTITRIVAATEDPVSVDELLLHARIDGTADRQDIADKITAATRYVETTELRGRALVTSQWELALESWLIAGYGAADGRRCSFIEVPLGNLQSVESITYRTCDGASNTLATTDYRLERRYVPSAISVPPSVDDIEGDGDTDKGIGRIYLAYGKYWPYALLDVGEPIVIAFTCGWEDAASVPVPLKLAIEMLAAHWYRNREAVTVGSRTAGGGMEATPMISTPLALSVESLCSPYVDRR